MFTWLRYSIACFSFLVPIIAPPTYRLYYLATHNRIVVWLLPQLGLCPLLNFRSFYHLFDKLALWSSFVLIFLEWYIIVVLVCHKVYLQLRWSFACRTIFPFWLLHNFVYRRSTIRRRGSLLNPYCIVIFQIDLLCKQIEPITTCLYGLLSFCKWNYLMQMGIDRMLC